MQQFNFGCGANKIDGFVNCDADPAVNPDRVINLVDEKDLESLFDETASKIVCYHTLEHIPKDFHSLILLHFSRILIYNGELQLSFPDFTKCSSNWLENKQGRREFWEATIFGRGASILDRHVCAMTTAYIQELLFKFGFETIYAGPEPLEDYNSVIIALNKRNCTSYEDRIKKEMFSNA